MSVVTRSRRRTLHLCQRFESATVPRCQCMYNIHACCCHDPSTRSRVDSACLKAKSRDLSQAWESQFDKERQQIERDRQIQEFHQQSKLRAQSLRLGKEALWTRNNRRQRMYDIIEVKEQAEKDRTEIKLKALINDVGSLVFGQMQDNFRNHYRKEIASGFASLLDYQLVVFCIHSSLDSKLGGDTVELLLEFIPDTLGDWLEFRGEGCVDVAEEYARDQYTGDRVFDAHFLKCIYDPSVMSFHSGYNKNALTFNLEA